MTKLHHVEIHDARRPVVQMDMTRQSEREPAAIEALVKTLSLNL